jgi:hypothetical protein
LRGLPLVCHGGGAIIKKLSEKRVKNLDLDYDFDAELETTTIY